MIRENFFHFQIFQIYGNLKIYFGISSGELSMLSVLHYFFIKILTCHKTDLKHVVKIPSQQGYDIV